MVLILTGIALWIVGGKRKTHDFIFKTWWRKVFRLILISTPSLAYMSYLAGSYVYLRHMPMFLFVIFTALLLTYSPTEGVSWYKVIYKIITSKDTQASRLRSRLLQLIGYFTVAYWIFLLLLAPVAAQSIKDSVARHLASLTSPIKYRLPEAGERIYQQVLDPFDKENISKYEIYGLLGMVMPDDLPAVLRKLNTMKFSNHWGMMGMMGMMPMPMPVPVNKKVRLNEEEKTGLCDEDLIRIMEYCGRDVVNIIVDFLDNPESEMALIGRAKLGDRSVRGKLKTIWDSQKQDNFGFRSSSSSWQSNWVGPNCGPASEFSVRAGDILSGLACVCEPDEAAGYFLDYIDMDATPESDIYYDHEFFRSLRLLPSAQVREVLKVYLIKNKNTAKIGAERHTRTQFLGMIPFGMPPP